MSRYELRNKKVLVTGATGMVGQQVVPVLESRGASVHAVGNCHEIWAMGYTADGVDLLNPIAVSNFFACHGPFHCVLHLAGDNGGLFFTARRQFDIFSSNTLMGLNLLRECVEQKVEKVISLVASCAYEDTTCWPDGEPDGPIPEDSPFGVLYPYAFNEGSPHPTVAGHGYAKRNLQIASRMMAQQGMSTLSVCLCPPTLFGPKQRCDERAKFIGALVKKICDAQKNNLPAVEFMGTGKALREVMYVKDAAELIVRGMETYDNPNEPLNLGPGWEKSVKDFARCAAWVSGYEGERKFVGGEDGQLRKRLDCTGSKKYLGEFQLTPLSDALKETVDDYRRGQGPD